MKLFYLTIMLVPKIVTENSNNEKKENPDVVKEKATIEKIKMLYKGEKKRAKNSKIDPKIMTLRGTKNLKRKSEIQIYVTQKMSDNTASGIPWFLAINSVKTIEKGDE